jgi:hypothetical protein
LDATPGHLWWQAHGSSTNKLQPLSMGLLSKLIGAGESERMWKRWKPTPIVLVQLHRLRHHLAVLHQLHLLGQRALQLPAHCPCCGWIYKQALVVVDGVGFGMPLQAGWRYFSPPPRACRPACRWAWDRPGQKTEEAKGPGTSVLVFCFGSSQLSAHHFVSDVRLLSSVRGVLGRTTSLISTPVRTDLRFSRSQELLDIGTILGGIDIMDLFAQIKANELWAAVLRARLQRAYCSGPSGYWHTQEAQSGWAVPAIKQPPGCSLVSINKAAGEPGGCRCAGMRA